MSVKRGYHCYLFKYGFIGGIALTYLYTTIFILYAIIRTSQTIQDQLAPSEGLYSTLFANATSILISSLGITMLIAPGAGLLGMVTIIILRWLLKIQVKGYTYLPAALTGFLTCLILSMILQAFLFGVTGFSWTKSSPEAYWFWFGFPAIIYMITGIIWADNFYKHKIRSN